ncbi:MAG: helix-turn-helix domain-containing protein [Clostridia bacterium]|nr:helix-turn-helix domain-containing protein [Clostridia bacterium]
MIDISKNELYVKCFEGVHQDYIAPRKIPYCRPRYCDAFVYILGGSCKYTLRDDNRSFKASAGDLLYLAHGAVYKMDVLERYDFVCINFFFDCEGARASNVFKLKNTDKTEGLFFQTLKDSTRTTLTYKTALLYHIYNDLILSQKNSYLPNGLREKIDEAITTISKDPQNPPSIYSLAVRAEMSEVYFRKLFKSVMGVSPAKFITDCRIARAKELLTAEYLSPVDVAERCGFSSVSYFCRVFKKSVGITPSEYKKRINP